MRQTLRLATRGSKLALWQARFVQQQLTERYPDLNVELCVITTTGDRITDRPLADIGGKGLFIKELEHALLNNEADIAVHSMKDVPPEIPDAFTLAAILERDDVRDALVSRNNLTLQQLPQGATVGTSSVRRTAQLLHHRPDLLIAPLRGNMDTRLNKLDNGDYDAIVLAAAGLKRLGRADRISEYFAIETMLPSVAQGAIGIECRAEDAEIIALLQPLQHAETALCVHTERTVVRGLNGNCHSPIGVYARIESDTIKLNALVASMDGREIIRSNVIGAVNAGEKIAEDMVANLKRRGSDQLLLH